MTDSASKEIAAVNKDAPRNREGEREGEEHRYFILDRGVRVGPFSRERIYEIYQRGQMPGDALCCPDREFRSMADPVWRPLCDVFRKIYPGVLRVSGFSETGGAGRRRRGASTMTGASRVAPVGGRPVKARRGSRHGGTRRHPGFGAVGSPGEPAGLAGLAGLLAVLLLVLGLVLGGSVLRNEFSGEAIRAVAEDPFLEKEEKLAEMVHRGAWFGAGAILVLGGALLLSACARRR